MVETDWSVPRALARVVEREHRDLLVVGSSRAGADGLVHMGSRTRQLLDHSSCALAVAPRGMRDRVGHQLARIGVGFDGSLDSEAALTLAAGLATAAGARLTVRGVVDDRLPMVGWSPAQAEVLAMWSELIGPQVDALQDRAQRAANATGANVEVGVERGHPADALIELSASVDLLVIGSRRWGTTARVLLGSTGEALMRGASCPVLVVPRPDA